MAKIYWYRLILTLHICYRQYRVPFNVCLLANWRKIIFKENLRRLLNIINECCKSNQCKLRTPYFLKLVAGILPLAFMWSIWLFTCDSIQTEADGRCVYNCAKQDLNPIVHCTPIRRMDTIQQWYLGREQSGTLM